jgi:hypothetical protein
MSLEEKQYYRFQEEVVNGKIISINLADPRQLFALQHINDASPADHGLE